MTKTRIAIDARLTPTAPGGMLQVVCAVAHGLSQLADSDQRYAFLVTSDYDGWLDAYLGDNCELVRSKSKGGLAATLGKLKARSGLFAAALPESDGTVEEHRFDGIHFLLPMGFRTAIPTMYHVHDLQHLHFPEYFSPRTRNLRRVVFPQLCEQALRVCTMTRWGKKDIVQKLGVPDVKVSVVPWGSLLEAGSVPTQQEMASLRRRVNVEEPFAFFPAKAYPHKNHLRLLSAVAQLRDSTGLRVPLVLTGADGAATSEIENAVRSHRLQDQVHHLGFVAPSVMTALFHLCRCVVFPSLFEGWGLPLSEALSIGKPVACSNTTCLPEVTQGAADYFDPYSVESIADGLRRVWTDSDLQLQLRNRAADVARQLTWENTARQLRDHYRELFQSPPARNAA